VDSDRTRPDPPLERPSPRGTLIPPRGSGEALLAPGHGTIMFEGALLAGRYCLLKKLGEGGMGRVWLATHIGLGRLTAIKVLHHERHGCADTRERFRREALAGGALQHRHIVPHLDFGTLDDGRDYLATEYIEGRTLAEALRTDGPMHSSRVVEIGAQIASALSCAHRASIIHRDIKPSNILLESRTGWARVLDFGVAHLAALPGDRLTMEGAMLGTPSYCAPEQRDGLEIDERVDLYSLGLVLFEALVGRKPQPGENLDDSLDDAPRPLRNLVVELCDPQADQRPRTAREVESRLARLRHGARRRAVWIAVGVALAASTLGTLAAAI
jgi:eukaryotic-like serine/threonine-protein kinase